MTTLETPRLILRSFEPEDFEAYAEICADPEVMQYLHGYPMTRLEAWRHMAMVIGHWHLRGYGFWAVEERSTGALIGRIGFNNPEGWPGFEVGWTLARSHWGLGLAVEGATAALNHGFGPMGRDHVISVIHPENARSIKVAERLGEQFEIEDEVMGIRVLIFGMDRETWQART
ncbi:GNAT family N-acetyltransferase [soil metagenome]